MGVFTPWKSANATNQGLGFVLFLDPVYKNSTGTQRNYHSYVQEDTVEETLRIHTLLNFNIMLISGHDFY